MQVLQAKAGRCYQHRLHGESQRGQSLVIWKVLLGLTHTQEELTHVTFEWEERFCCIDRLGARVWSCSCSCLPCIPNILCLKTLKGGGGGGLWKC